MESTKNQRIVSTLIEKVWDNPALISALETNPEEAISKITGESLDIPAGIKLEVVDQSNPSTLYINIPPNPNMEEVELNEELLDTIAGGDGDLNLGDMLSDVLDALKRSIMGPPPG